LRVFASSTSTGVSRVAAFTNDAIGFSNSPDDKKVDSRFIHQCATQREKAPEKALFFLPRGRRSAGANRQLFVARRGEDLAETRAPISRDREAVAGGAETHLLDFPIAERGQGEEGSLGLEVPELQHRGIGQGQAAAVRGKLQEVNAAIVSLAGHAG